MKESYDSTKHGDPQAWRDLVEQSPVAFYILRNNSDFTILYANDGFYRLMNQTHDAVSITYGNRLGAMLNTMDYQNECHKQNKVSSFYHDIKINGEIRHLFTEVCFSEDHALLYCISMDVTAYQNEKHQTEHLDDVFHEVMLQVNLEVFEYDIEKNIATIESANHYLSNIPNVVSHEDFEMYFLQALPMEQEYADSLRHAFEKVAQQKVSTINEIKLKDQNWLRITLLPHYDREHEELSVLGLVENITTQKQSNVNYLYETQFYHTLLAEKEAYGHVNVSTNTILTIGGIWNLYNELITKMSFSELFIQFVEKVVHPDDRKQYLELLDLKNLEQSYERGIRKLSCEFRRIVSQNKMVWMRVEALLFKEPFHGDLMGLVYLDNIDEQKKKNLQLQRKSKEKMVSEPLLCSLSDKEQALIQQFDTFIGNQGEMAYLVDPESFDLILGNQAFYDRVGLTKEECQGKKCYEVMHRRSSPCPFCGKANWKRDKFFMWKDVNTALEQDFIIKNKLIEYNGQDVLLALAIDVSNDKSIVDSIALHAPESHILLSGIQRMEACVEIKDAMTSILETICQFFDADHVAFWKVNEAILSYENQYQWIEANQYAWKLDQEDIETTSSWLNGKQWDQPLLIENPQVMLGESYDMYQLMMKYNIHNQRWIRIKDQEYEYGCIVINNIHANFQNISFLESLSTFIANELKKRRLLDASVHANKYDMLTDLLNRNSYEENLHRYQPDQLSSLGVLVANIDNLKGINEASGTAAGNHYIKRLANLMKKTFSQGDVYRLNGDEFLVICADVDKNILEAQAKELRTKLLQREHFSASIGYAWDDVEKDLISLTRTATELMNIHKKRYYDENHESKNIRHQKQLKNLVDGINNGKFRVYLQPKYNIDKNELMGAEALIRQYHEELGILSPAEFIPVLEENGLIRYIDIFVFEEVCKLLTKWKQKDIVISLNFSRVTLMEENLLETVQQILQKYEFDHSKLEIEITESTIEACSVPLYETVSELANLGLRISLDDFGIKYSNLAVLTDISFDTLKLDKSLIKSLANQRRNRLILKNIIQMCKDLDIEVIAEGVETKRQELVLKMLNCSLGQGYLYSKPIPIADFEKSFMNEE